MKSYEELNLTQWQRCVVHWYRNIFSHVPSTRVREIAAMLKAIHASEDLVAAREKAIRVIEKLRGLRLTRAAELVEAAVEETLSMPFQFSPLVGVRP
jgi:transposase-like protein